MIEINVSLVNKSNQESPHYQTAGSAGMDLRANLDAPIALAPQERALIPTGLHIQLPTGYEAQIRPRSGLAFKHGITCLNAPGTIDSDYTGEIKVLLINHGNTEFLIEHGERIAQMVVAPYVKVEWNEVEKLEETARGAGGFGSTGKK